MFVVRKHGLTDELYLNARVKWVPYNQAKRFATADQADRFAATHGITDHGVFPCGRYRKSHARTN